MRRFIGEEKLSRQNEVAFTKGITKITDGVYFTLGYGGSNAILVEGNNSCVLVDTLNGMTVAEEAVADFKKITDKPIKHIIYTHYSHFDHVSGAGAFYTEGCDVYAKVLEDVKFGHTHIIGDILAKRGACQFGVGLTPEEFICVGTAPMNDVNTSKKHIIPPNKFFEGEEMELNLDGVKVKLVYAPGESDDQIFIYFPEKKVLCCGDNYAEAWPNLSPIRGGKYRDINVWINSLTKMLDYDVDYLLPAHTKAIIGKEKVRETLTNFRDGLEYVLIETLKGMNEGFTPDELVHKIKLPEHLSNLNYLEEYYGTIEWAIRAIYSAYLGWFDGNPLHLVCMPPKEKAEKTLEMMGGYEKVFEGVKKALENEEDQWALELLEILTATDNLTDEAKNLKVQALINLGRNQTSAPGRHYYYVCARRLMGNLENGESNIFRDIDKIDDYEKGLE